MLVHGRSGSEIKYCHIHMYKTVSWHIFLVEHRAELVVPCPLGSNLGKLSRVTMFSQVA